MHFVGNKLAVTREYKWTFTKSGICSFNYFISNAFEITLDKNTTKWQILICYHNGEFFGFLDYIESSFNDFSVDMTVYSYPTLPQTGAKENGINKHYERFPLHKEWFFIRKYYELLNHNNDFFILSFEITISENFKEITLVVEPQGFSSNEELLEMEDFNDFTYVCSDGKKVRANKAILSVNSSVMKTMFESPMIESKKMTAVLDDIDSDTMIAVLRFIYCGKAENIDELAPKMLYCAEKYNLKELKEFCLKFLLKNVSKDNVIEYITLADRYDTKLDLFERCLLVLTCNYEDISKQDDWIKLDQKIRIFASMKNTKSETFFLHSAKRYEFPYLPEQYLKISY